MQALNSLNRRPVGPGDHQGAYRVTSNWRPVPPPEEWQYSPVELREFLREHGLTGSEAGALIGVDGRTIRKWTGGDRDMPYSAWFTLVHRAPKQEKKG